MMIFYNKYSNNFFPLQLHIVRNHPTHYYTITYLLITACNVEHILSQIFFMLFDNCSFPFYDFPSVITMKNPHATRYQCLNLTLDLRSTVVTSSAKFQVPLRIHFIIPDSLS